MKNATRFAEDLRASAHVSEGTISSILEANLSRSPVRSCFSGTGRLWPTRGCWLSPPSPLPLSRGAGAVQMASLGLKGKDTELGSRGRHCLAPQP